MQGLQEMVGDMQHHMYTAQQPGAADGFMYVGQICSPEHVGWQAWWCMAWRRCWSRRRTASTHCWTQAATTAHKCTCDTCIVMKLSRCQVHVWWCMAWKRWWSKHRTTSTRCWTGAALTAHELTRDTCIGMKLSLPGAGVVVHGLEEMVVKTQDDIYALLYRGSADSTQVHM